jgi:hypothetical protein
MELPPSQVQLGSPEFGWLSMKCGLAASAAGTNATAATTNAATTRKDLRIFVS